MQMVEVFDIFAANLKRLRNAKGWSQAELAEVAGFESYMTVQNYERKTRWPEKKFVKALAKALEVSTVDLFKLPEEFQANFSLPEALSLAFDKFSNLSPVRRKVLIAILFGDESLVQDESDKLAQLVSVLAKVP